MGNAKSLDEARNVKIFGQKEIPEDYLNKKKEKVEDKEESRKGGKFL